ncbi:hypothetical protein [Bartonella doshiae]|uniref:Uncharacterized protein n=2 Tax=Bartonella doshiae TaxID=33044 RepID=A0A380ZBH6_BARDO|nr:hypothetical protein [Bartonella doshiae]EJF79608.1 hypothetical protein MCS_01335 [Bartonella doshiae NCTC 12862 = ATCC 700133]MBB6160039.1 hypothetical protein [Bartonella doshiae]SUV44358.1 Uncharacterised protein [Bartonella doshiae]
MKVDTNFLCDLWMALSQFSNHQSVGYGDCNALVQVMGMIEKVLILKLQDELPNALKILAILTDFGYSEFPTVMVPLLKAYEPNLESPIKKVA